MGAFFAYTLKAAICLMLFFPFYKLLLSKESFHSFNRIALISLMLFSFALPFFQIDFSSHDVEQSSAGIDVGQITSIVMIDDDNTEIQTPFYLRIMTWFILIYMCGMVVMIVRDIVIYASLALALRKGRRIEGFSIRGQKLPADIKLIVHEKDTAPFSWMKYIVVSSKDLKEAAEPILAHEMGHVRHRHTLDLLFTEVCLVFQWFNPAMWLMRQELQAIHEFEADEDVLNFGVNAKQYQLLIIKKAAGSRLQSITNSLHHSSIKKRITMMLKQKSNPWAKAKYLFALPVAAISVAVFANPKVSEITSEISDCKVSEIFLDVQEKGSSKFVTIVADETNDTYSAHLLDSDGAINPEVLTDKELKEIYSENDCMPLKVASETPMKYVTDFKNECRENGMTRLSYSSSDKAEPSSIIETIVEETKKDDDDFKTVVEQQPMFPGGEKAMMEFVKNNLKYPASCAEEGIQGRVTLSFIVEKDGSISNIEEIRSPHADLTAAAINVLEAMPKWTPGMQSGEAVRVKYVIPISFRLPDTVTKVEVSSNGDKTTLNHPLVLVDGEVVEDINSIDPQTIESVDVFKGDNPKMEEYIKKYEKAKHGVIFIHLKK